MTYLNALNLHEALQVLQENNGQARIIAGGTDLYLQHLPPVLVDISNITEINVIKETEDRIIIGACTTHSAALASSCLRKYATALAEGCHHIGSTQVRNLGTIGGNVINAAPAADAAVALVALDATAEIIDTVSSRKKVSVDELYARYNCCHVDSTREILMTFSFRKQGRGEGSSFQRFSARKALSLPMVNSAVWIQILDELIKDVRIVIAPFKPFPTRLIETEKAIRGLAVTNETWELAVEKSKTEVAFRGSPLRGSAEYRNHIAGILLKKALAEAAQRANKQEIG